MTIVELNPQPVRWAIWLVWVLASILGLAIGPALGLLLMFPEAMSAPGGVNANHVFRGMPMALAPSSTTAVVRAIGGAVGGAGVLVGTLQWLILRRHFYRAGSWVLASTLGLAIALTLGGTMGGMVIGAFGGAVVGFLEWLVIRQYVYKAGWWVLAVSWAWPLVWL